MNRYELAEDLARRQKRAAIDRQIREILTGHQPLLSDLSRLAMDSIIYRVKDDLSAAIVIVVNENRLTDTDVEVALNKRLMFDAGMAMLREIVSQGALRFRDVTFHYIIQDPKDNILVDVDPTEFTF